MKTTFDPLAQRYPSQRFPIYARGGMVNCSCPMASAAGLDALKNGGNAVDAIVAAAAALTVCEPTDNGLGADAFALVWSEKEQKLFGLNASGPAPMLASAENILSSGKAADGKMPALGWTPVTVPGAVKAWKELTKRFGTRSLSENLAPAVHYAEDGYAISPNIARSWQNALSSYKKRLSGPEFAAWFDTFTFDAEAPKPGSIVKLPAHAKTLSLLGSTDTDALYHGELGDQIEKESLKYGGLLRKSDLERFEAQWVEPIRVNYRGYEVCEIPPNGQGIVALMALNILKEFDFADPESPLTRHRQIEALKIAFQDAFASVTDPFDMPFSYHDLLQPQYGALRAREITDRAQTYGSKIPPKSGTVYLCAADSEGNMVSYIQSNYMGFGSCIVIPGTGIGLQNRGADFSLNPADANFIRPGKRSYHTIIPGFIMKDKLPVGPFGVMGGYMQPQGHVQVAMNYIDFGMDPQQALDAPRFQWMRDGSVTVESRFDANLARSLSRMGHEISVDLNTGSFGRGQMIVKLDNGVLVGGTESRTDSNIACF